ncbi:MAG: septum site-determining protein MinC [Xenococcaceae cyanobacterium]
MTSDSALPVPGSNVSQHISLVNRYSQVRLKSEGKKLLLILPTEAQTEPTQDWSEVWQELKCRLNGSERSWQPGTAVHLMAKDRLLDGRQLQTIAEALREVDLQLKWVCTSRRQTAVAAATAGYSVEQESPTHSFSSAPEQALQELAEPLYMQGTVRSGIEVRHPGTVLLLGDLNPGGTVIAAGDILVWGRLRGIAHAGAQGNRECRIMALQMEPTQLRIADAVARAPEVPPAEFEPEVAYITPEGIRLTKVVNFGKIHAIKWKS